MVDVVRLFFLKPIMLNIYNRRAWIPERFCDATGALRLLPLKALAQNVQDYVRTLTIRRQSGLDPAILTDTLVVESGHFVCRPEDV